MRLLDNKALHIDDGKNNKYQKDGKWIKKYKRETDSLDCTVFITY